jgi:hypothetical protein
MMNANSGDLNMNSEIGRQLKVSELKPRTVVVLHKQDRRLATLWVRAVGTEWVEFYAGVTETTFLARRTGLDLESITDDTNRPIEIFEYLGDPK